jgi:putative SOS response-associated peptidase YedK
MCGRLNIHAKELAQTLLVYFDQTYPGSDNFNVAPTETVPVMRANAHGAIEFAHMRWWLTPSWAKAPSTQYSMFNAKSETAGRSPAFREPYLKKRCVVPVSGFYEWYRGRKRKMPYLIRGASTKTLLLAGLWDSWSTRGSSEVAAMLSFTLLTTAAHEQMRQIHDRQPIFLTPDHAKAWLDTAIPTQQLEFLFASKLPVALEGQPVSTWVNTARHKDERCHQFVGSAVQINELR